MTSLLRAALVLGVEIVAITEALSAFGAISFGGIAIADSLAAAVGLFYLRRSPIAAAPEKKAGDERWSTVDLVLLAGVGVLLVLALIVAIVAPPNSIDTMGYHLSRVMHWIQNGSVAAYPTSDLRQLRHPPFAEYVFLHLMVLTRGDRLVNLVQWSAFALALAAVSLIAREIGAGRRGQLMAIVVAATIPKGLLQATGAKNDWVMVLWIVCAIAFLLRFRRTTARTDAVAAAAALGLAILTKVTAGLFLLPLVAWLAISAALRLAASRAFATGAIAAVIFSVVVAGHVSRNVRLFGSPMGESEVVRNYGIESDAMVALFSNSIRNAAVQLATPWPAANDLVEAAVGRIHTALGLDPQDPRTTAVNGFYLHDPFGHEVLSGSPLHAIVAAWALAAVALVGRWRAKTDVVFYSAALLFAFALFSTLIRFQVPNSRLLFPLFVMGAPVVGVLLGDALRPRVATVVAAILLLLAPPWIAFNATRPLLGATSVLRAPRIDQYFVMRPDLQRPYEQACEQLRNGGYRDLGLVINDGQVSYEYPIWKLLESRTHPVRIEHVKVRNESKRLSQDEPFASFVPSAVLVIDSWVYRTTAKQTIEVKQAKYVRSWGKRGFALYVRAPEPAAG